MRRRFWIEGALGGICLLCGMVSALTLELRTSADLKGEDYPDPALQLINRKDVVQAFADEIGLHVCLSDAVGLNRFLEQAVAVDDADVTIVLTPEPGKTTGGFGKDIAYAWGVAVRREDKADLAVSSRPGAKKWHIQVDVAVWAPLKIDDLQLPLKADVRLGGKLAALVQAHESRRAHNGAETEPTTSSKHLQQPGIFGHGSETTPDSLFRGEQNQQSPPSQDDSRGVK